jgi:hypothetical protein
VIANKHHAQCLKCEERFSLDEIINNETLETA